MATLKNILDLKSGDKFYGLNTWYGDIDILECIVEEVWNMDEKICIYFHYTIPMKNNLLDGGQFCVNRIEAASPVVSPYSDKCSCFFADINLFNERLGKLINITLPQSLLACIDVYNKIKLEIDGTNNLS